MAVKNKEDLLAQLKAMRDSIGSGSITDLDSIERALDEISDEIYENGDKEEFQSRIDSIVDELAVLKVQLDAIKSAQDSTTRNIQALIESEEKELNGSETLSEEEIISRRNEIAREKAANKTAAIEQKKRIADIASRIKFLSELRENLEAASSIGLSIREFDDINSKAFSKRIFSKILESEGIDRIFSTEGSKLKADERRKFLESKRKIKDEIIRKIAQHQKEHPKTSVIDAIKAIYNVDVQMTTVGQAREVSIGSEELDKVRENVQLLPASYVDRGDAKASNNSSIAAAPSDMLSSGIRITTDDFIAANKGSVEDVLIGVTSDAPGAITPRQLAEEDAGRKLTDEEYHELYKEGFTGADQSDDYGSITEISVYKKAKVPTKQVVEDEKIELVEIGSTYDAPGAITPRQIAEEDAGRELTDEEYHELYREEYTGADQSDDYGAITEIKVYKKVKVPTKQVVEDEKVELVEIGSTYDAPGAITPRQIAEEDAGRELTDEEYHELYEEQFVEGANQSDDYGAITEIKVYRKVKVSSKDVGEVVPADSRIAAREDDHYELVPADSKVVAREDDHYELVPADSRVAAREDEHYEIVPADSKVAAREDEHYELVPADSRIAAREDDSDDENTAEDEDEDVLIGVTSDAPGAITPRQLAEEDAGRELTDEEYHELYEERFTGADQSDDYGAVTEISVYRLGRKNRKKPDKKVEPEEKDETEDENNLSSDTTDIGMIDRVIVYRNTDDGSYYARPAAIARYELDSLGDSIRPDDAPGIFIRITDESFERLQSGSEDFSRVSPYILEVREYRPKKELEDSTTYPIGPTNKPVPPRPTPTDPIRPTPTPVKPDPTDPIRPTPTPAKPDPTDPIRPTPTPAKPDPTDPIRPTPTPVRTNPTQTTPPKKPVLSLEGILQKITANLGVVKAKDGKRFQASNIRVFKSFKNEVSTGNIYYNVGSLAGSIIALPIRFFKKVFSKILLGGRGKRAMEQLRANLDSLSPEELDVLYTQYRGSAILQDMNNQINPVIMEKIAQYGREKLEKYNNDIRDLYCQLFTLLQQIDTLDAQIKDPNTTATAKNAFVAQRKKIYASAAQIVVNIRELRKEANMFMSGGIHGQMEDAKATATKLNYVGMRFAKEHAFDHELQEKLGQYDDGVEQGIADGNPEAIVDNFMNLESLYSDNTRINGSIFGRRSSGKKYYSPLISQLDYRDDPFIRNLLTSISVISSIASIYNAYRVHAVEQQRAIDDYNSQVNGINQHNQGVMNQVNQHGRDIESRRGVFQEGMEAQTRNQSMALSGNQERMALDEHGWGSFSDAYHAADAHNHKFYNNAYDQTMADLNAAVQGYGTGALTQAQALQRIANAASQSQKTLTSICSQYQSILAKYATDHPQFDLHSLQESIDYIVNNPNSIAAMNQGMVDVTNIGTTLSSMTGMKQLAFLDQLPSDMATTIASAVAACCLANNVLGSMERTRDQYATGARGYGNDIVDMMRDYAESHGSENSSGRTR